MGMRNLLAHRGRLALTFATVVLSVAFVAGTLFFADSITPAPGAIRTDVAVLVTPAGADDDGEYDPDRALLPEQQRQRLAALPGVARADGIVYGYAAVVGADGKVARPPGFANDLIGTNWTGSPRLRLLAGRAPSEPGEIAVEEVTARNGELAPGTSTRTLYGAGTDEVKVVGVFSYHPVLRDGPGRAPALAFDTATAQRLLQAPDTFTSVELTAEPGVTSRQLRDTVAAALPATFTAQDGALLAERSREQEEGDAATAAQILLTFTLIALLVGTTLITNTFTMLVGQRTRQFGMLRAVGARRRQIEGMVVAEAAGVGVLGTAAGLLIGLGLALPMIEFAATRDAFLGDTLRVTPGAVLASMFVGIAITMLAAWLPARRAAAAPPVVALQGDLVLAVKAQRARTVIGSVLAMTAALLLLLAPLGDQPPFTVAGGAGAFVLLIAVVMLAAQFARPLVRAMVSPFRSRPLARLAAENTLRNPRRTAATISALLVGVALATGIAVFGTSVAQADRAATERTLRAPFIAVNIGGGEISNDTMQRIRAVPGVTLASPIRRDSARSDGEGMSLAAVDPAALGPLLHLDLRSGTPSELARGAFAAESLAAQRGWSPGDVVRLSIGDRPQPVQVTITDVYSDTPLLGNGLLVSDEFADRHFRRHNGGTLLIGADTDEQPLHRELTTAVADRPDVRLYTADRYLGEEVSQLSGLVSMSTALLGLSMVIAVLGIVNTLALSVLERTREVGLLRAIGMRRRKVRAMIRIEAVLIAMVGGVLGVGVGAMIGAMFQHAVVGQPIRETVLPWPSIGGLLLAMAVAGVLAAEWPARNAARTDILTAIGTQ
ncbi:ABC transporter permease [Micromonosporaceae bacterium B7E4]